ncbi:MAG: hypothetical protein H6705_02980 [Myxococcales bacterium]|nr:hypothetical protein [Myxococcales bacterium]
MSDITAEPTTVRGALRAELRHLARRFGRAFGWTLMVGVGLLAMFFAHGVLTAPPSAAATGLSRCSRSPSPSATASSSPSSRRWWSA